MAKVFLKTIFSAPNELKFLKLNLEEAYDYIDKFIVCEFNRTHVGEKRELVFEQFLDTFTEKQRSKLVYIGADISDLTRHTKEKRSEDLHFNERLMRGYFQKEIDLGRKDIVFSVDADEVVFKGSYEKIINEIGLFNKVYALRMRQFYYRINYLWQDMDFLSPIACRADFYPKKDFPSQWRDVGKSLPGYFGCHFSWCLSTEEMIQKLHSYAHSDIYSHLAQKEILEEAVAEKKYPFDPDRDFRLRTLDLEKDREYFPASLNGMLSDFQHLIGA